MKDGISQQNVRSAGTQSRSHLLRLAAAWLVGTLISFPSPGTTPATENFFLNSYNTALNLLKHNHELGRPLLESTYDSLYLYELCAATELSSSGRSKAAGLLNQKLASPSFAKAYDRYKSSGRRLLSKQEAKTACAALAQYGPN